MSPRVWCSALGSILLWSSCSASGAPAENRELTILYTADAQGYLKECACETGGMLGGIARRTALIDSLRGEGSDLLLLEAGDFATGPGAYGEIVGLVAARAMARMNYDAVLPGEVELNLGADFWRKAKAVELPFVHTNFGTPELGAPTRRALVLEKGGRRIAVLGLLGPDLYFLPETKERLEVLPPEEAARAAVEQLPSDVDLVIAIVHMRQPDLERLAEQIPELDLLVAGHTSKNLAAPERRGSSLLLSAGFLGQQVGRLRLRGSDLGSAENSLIRLEPELPEDPEVARWVGIAAPR